MTDVVPNVNHHWKCFNPHFIPLIIHFHHFLVLVHGCVLGFYFFLELSYSSRQHWSNKPESEISTGLISSKDVQNLSLCVRRVCTVCRPCSRWWWQVGWLLPFDFYWQSTVKIKKKKKKSTRLEMFIENDDNDINIRININLYHFYVQILVSRKSNKTARKNSVHLNVLIPTEKKKGEEKRIIRIIMSIPGLSCCCFRAP